MVYKKDEFTLNAPRHPASLLQVRSKKQYKINSKEGKLLLAFYGATKEDWTDLRTKRNQLLRYIYGDRNMPGSQYFETYLSEKWHSNIDYFEFYLATPDWRNKRLELNLIIPDNKLIGPDTCMLISNDIPRGLLNDSRIIPRVTWGNMGRGSIETKVTKYKINYKGQPIKYFNSKEAGIVYWREMKRDEVLAYVDKTDDPKVKDLLIKRGEYFMSEPVAKNEYADKK